MTNLNSTTNFADPDGVAAAYIAAAEAVDAATWATFATGYRTARKAYGVADVLLSEPHVLELHDKHHRNLQGGLVAFEVATAAELIEKGELIALDTYDSERVAEALMADLARVRAARAEGGEAAELGAAYLAAVARADAAPEDEAEQAWSESEGLWQRLALAPVITQADAAAKLDSVLAWTAAGSAERSDGTDRAMLAEASAYLKH